MKFGGKTAVGLDISEKGIRMVVLRRGKAGVELVRSAAAQLPAGAVKDGNIENAAILSKAIRDLKRRSRIRSRRAAAALFGKPAIMQIIDMPKQIPSNIRQYVQNEVKHYVATPGKDIVFDYYAVTSTKRSADKRVLTATTDGRKMTELVRACSRAGLDVEVIEPPLLAYIRAVHGKKVAGKSGANVLIAMLRGQTLMLSVLGNQAIDFVRTKDVRPEQAEGERVCDWLADEILQVMQFYETEMSGGSAKWEITIFVDSEKASRQLEETIKSRSSGATVEIRTTDDACLDTPVQRSQDTSAVPPSPVAVGLAMRLLEAEPGAVKVNLMPSDLVKLREVKTEVLIAANIAAVILLIMILAVEVPARMAERIAREVAQKKQVLADQDIQGLLASREGLDKQLQFQSQVIGRISGIAQAHRSIDWANLLEDIGKATPTTVCITNIENRDGLKLTVEGLALSNEAVQSFINTLRKASRIRSASLVEAQKYDQQSGVVKYEISCSIAAAKENGLNAG